MMGCCGAGALYYRTSVNWITRERGSKDRAHGPGKAQTARWLGDPDFDAGTGPSIPVLSHHREGALRNRGQTMSRRKLIGGEKMEDDHARISTDVGRVRAVIST